MITNPSIFVPCERSVLYRPVCRPQRLRALDGLREAALSARHRPGPLMLSLTPAPQGPRLFSFPLSPAV